MKMKDNHLQDELELQIYRKSISVDEHRKLRDAVERAADHPHDGEGVTCTISYGKRAAIVPVELAEYAIRHGYFHQ